MLLLATKYVANKLVTIESVDTNKSVESEIPNNGVETIEYDEEQAEVNCPECNSKNINSYKDVQKSHLRRA